MTPLATGLALLLVAALSGGGLLATRRWPRWSGALLWSLLAAVLATAGLAAAVGASTASARALARLVLPILWASGAFLCFWTHDASRALALLASVALAGGAAVLAFGGAR